MADVQVVEFQGFYGPRCVQCPSCYVGVGSPCKKPSGHARFSYDGRKRVEDFCKARKDAAGKVSLQGVTCQKCGHADDPEHCVAPVVNAPKDKPEWLGQLWCTACVKQAVATLVGGT